MKVRLFTKKTLLNKRVAGFHDIRLDGMSDLLFRARDASVLDIGCNRGMISLEFAANGASRIHGCDYYEDGVRTVREIFSDIPAVESRFEVVDLRGGIKALEAAFNGSLLRYDITIFLAVDHQLQRVMQQTEIDEIVAGLAKRTKRYLAYRGRTGDRYEPMLADLGFKRIHYSEIAEHHFGAPAIIWERK